MTDIYLDGSRLDYSDTDKDSTISDLVVAVEKNLRELRRYITGVCVDGREMENWRCCGALGEHIAAHGEIRLESSSVETVALEGLHTVQEYVRVIGENIEACVKDIRLGMPAAEAGFISVFEDIKEAVKTLDALNRSAEKYGMHLFNENPAEYFRPLLKHMEALRGAMDAGDSVLLSDILEYELAPLMKEIRKKVFKGCRV